MSKTPPHIVEKIRTAHVRGESKLYLTGDSLTEVPPELFTTDSFDEIWLDYNKIRVIPPAMAQLKKLRYLVLYHNPIENVANVPGLVLDFMDYQRVRENVSPLNIAGLKLRGGLEYIYFLEELTNLTWLDLSENELTQIPEGITRLRHLTLLRLSSNWIKEIPDYIAQLQSLDELNLNSNHIKEISKHLTRLQNLKSLNLSANRLVGIPDNLGRMQNLVALDLKSNQIKKIPPQLAMLQNLKTLSLGSNQITEIPEHLCQLRNLTTLDLSHNQISMLPEELARLEKLVYIDLSSNLVKTLPAFMVRLKNFKKIYFQQHRSILDFVLPSEEREGICLSFNPIEYPPKEVITSGMEAVRSFFAQMEQQGKSKLYEAKLLLVGEPGAGKTSLLNKLLDESYVIPNPNEESTVGITVKTGWQFPMPQKPEVTFSANLWDFGGQEIQYMTHQFFLTSRALYVLLADDRKQHTQFDYWFNIIKLLGKGSPVLVVLNEKNCKPITNFDYDSYRKFYHEDFKLERCEVDLAETGPRFAHLRNTVQRLLTQLPHIGDELPARWIDIRQELEQQRERNHITLHEFKTLCEQHGIHKEVDQLTLSGYLHDLGVILHFQHDPQLADTLFLNPQWVVEAVYSVLDSDHAKKNKGRCTKRWMFEQWQSRGHDFSECNKLLSLMLKNNFELCYGLEGGSEEEYIAPQLLPSTRPQYEWHSAGNLLFRLQYPFMPKGIITRLIVRLHEWIERESDEGLVWERGVVLRKHGVRAQVTEEITKQEGLKVINIVLDGSPIAQKEMLAEIRAELRAIHDKSFRGINVKEMVPIPEQPEIAVPYEHLLLLEDKGIERFIPQGYSEEVEVRRLLNGIEPPQKRRREYERYEEDRPVSVHIDFKPEMKQYVNQNVQQTNTSTFNFDLHFNSLQSSLNELREELEAVAPEQAKEIADLRERLKKLEGTKEEDKAKAKESTALSKTRRLLESVNDTSTVLGKTVEKIKGGVGIVQDVAKHYNKIAEWCGLPQVPSVLLK